nr:polyamine aminopropyltransferase [Geitlerinema sp. PCC 9228]
MMTRYQRNLLLVAAAISSSSGLAVELLLGNLASYLVGNEALSYGIAVGGFLAAMGVGSYLSRFIADETSWESGEELSPQQREDLLSSFAKVELAIAPLTAFLPLGLFALFVVDGFLWLGLFLVTLVLGILAGLEIPLLTRLVEQEEGLREALAGVLAMDYLGALLGSLVFPVVLLPVFGMFPSAAIIGSLPAVMVFLLGRAFPQLRVWRWVGLAVAAGLLGFAWVAVPIGNSLENKLYADPVVGRWQSAYQRLVLTRWGRDMRLFLNGDLQLSTADEYRYHEALVHPAMVAAENPRRVLLLGAGDGMALREVLKWEQVERVLLLELDPAVVSLAQNHPFLSKLSDRAWEDPRVEVRYGDAFRIAPTLAETFDVIIADFPDPDRTALAKLYSKGFYEGLRSRLAPTGAMVTQASSPFFAPQAFACIAATLEASDMSVYPYRTDVPSFGPWGFVMAANQPFDPSVPISLSVKTRYLTPHLFPTLFQIPEDIRREDVEINTLAHPIIARYQSDRRWNLY